jgi:hypothetical protein
MSDETTTTAAPTTTTAAPTTTTAPPTTTTPAPTTTAPPTTTTAPPTTTSAAPTTTTAAPTTTTAAPTTTTTAPAATTTAAATTTTAPATTTTAPGTTTTAPGSTTTAPGTTTTAPGTTTSAPGTTTTAPGTTTTTAPGSTTTAPPSTTTSPGTTTTSGGPTVESFTGAPKEDDGATHLPDSLQIEAGKVVVLTWQVSNAPDGVELTDPAQSDPVKFDAGTSSTEVTPASDTQDYSLVAVSGDQRSEAKTVHVSTHTGGHVYSPHSQVLPPSQPPQINYFRIVAQGGDVGSGSDSLTAAAGASVTLAWEVEGGVAKLEIDNDVGDVTGKTAADGDTSGEGSTDVTLPTDSVTYTLTITPEDSSQSEVTATVTATVSPATTTTAPATTTTAPGTTTTAPGPTTTHPGTTTTAKPGTTTTAGPKGPFASFKAAPAVADGTDSPVSDDSRTVNLKLGNWVVFTWDAPGAAKVTLVYPLPDGTDSKPVTQPIKRDDTNKLTFRPPKSGDILLTFTVLDGSDKPIGDPWVVTVHAEGKLFTNLRWQSPGLVRGSKDHILADTTAPDDTWVDVVIEFRAPGYGWIAAGKGTATPAKVSGGKIDLPWEGVVAKAKELASDEDSLVRFRVNLPDPAGPEES